MSNKESQYSNEIVGMEENYSQEMQNFKNLTAEDLQKMRSNSIAKRQPYLTMWKDTERHIYNSSSSYLVRKGEEFCFSSTPATVLNELLDEIRAVNKPYVATFVLNPKNAKTPIYHFINTENTQNQASQMLSEEQEEKEKILKRLASTLNETLANNEEFQTVVNQAMRDYLLHGNACIQVQFKDAEQEEIEYKYIELDKISIEKNNNDITYFFRDIALTYNEFKDYFTDSYSLERLKAVYTDLDKPELMNDRQINIVECTYCCQKTGQSLIRYFFTSDTTTFIEESPRYRSYRVFLYIQNYVKNDHLYGETDITFTPYIADIKQLQVYAQANEIIAEEIIKSKSIKPMDVLSQQSQSTNEALLNRMGSEQQRELRAREMNSEKTVKIDFQLLASLGSSIFKNVNQLTVEDFQKAQEITNRFNILKETLIRNLLNQVNARKRIADENKKEITATELRLDSQQSRGYAYHILPSIEKFTQQLYLFSFEFTIHNVILVLEEHIKMHFKGDEKKLIKMLESGNRLDFYKKIIDEILSLDAGDIDETKKHIIEQDFSNLANNEFTQKGREQFAQINAEINQLLQIENKTAEQIMLLKKLKNESKDYERKYKKVLADLKINGNEELLNKARAFRQSEMFVFNLTKSQVLFFLSYASGEERVMFSLSSTEGKSLKSIESNNALEMVQIASNVANAIAPANPEKAKQILDTINSNEVVRYIASFKNAEKFIYTEKEMKKMQQEEQLKQQLAIAQQQQPQQ